MYTSTTNNKSVMNSSSGAMPLTTVGAEWVTVLPRPWWVPAGLEATQGPGAKPAFYRSPFFGAEREWKNDEEGWQLVSFHRSNRRSKNAYKRYSTLEEDNGESEYEMYDSYIGSGRYKW